MKVMLRRCWILAVAVVSVCLTPATSHATLTISLGNGSATNTLQFRTSPTPTTALLQDTAIHVDVMKVTVDQPGTINPGQTGMTPNTGNFATVIFDPIGPYVGFDAFEVNPSFDTVSGSFEVTGIDQFGNVKTRTITVDNGNNRFNIESDAIQYITQVKLTTNPANIDGITQVRIGALITAAAVPEPSALITSLIGCVGLGGFAGLRRIRRGR